MDAGFFRCLAREFVPELAGRRLMKAYEPAPDVLALELGPGGRGRYVLLRGHGRAPALFLAVAKPAAAAPPSAGAMWLRKRIAGRRILDVAAHWPGRCLALTLSPAPDFPGLDVLLLDLRAGASLVCALPEGFGAEPAWPDLARILADPEVWREFPHIGPALRRTLAALPEDQAAGLLARAQAGNCPIFYVYGTEALAWPLPEALAESLAGERRPQRFASALDAAEAAGQAMLFPYLEAAARSAQDAAAKAEARRLRRARENLDRDAERLAGLAALAESGERLKLVIGRHGSAARLARVSAPLSGGGEGAEGLIELDPRLTLSGNLERFFRLAAKGRRGLVHLAARREEFERRRAALAAGAAPWRPAREDAPRGKASPPAKSKAEARAEPFARFRTTEGLTVLRGKNAKANHALLSRVAGHDLWLHAAQGPSAHVVLRRDHPGVEVSEQSLAQAAALCANKSAGAGNARVEVMVAEVRHVRKVKGLAPGTVRVDKVWKVLAVAPDPGLETVLSEESP